MPKTFESPILTKWGEERHISWQNSEVREQGRVVTAIFFGTDITERRRMERDLIEGLLPSPARGGLRRRAGQS